MPLKLTGVVCLLVMGLAAWWLARSLLTFLLQMGLKRLLVRLLILYVGTAVLVAWLLPGSAQGVDRYTTAAGQVAAWAWSGLVGVGRGIALVLPIDIVKAVAIM